MLHYRLRESTRAPFPCPKDMDPTLHALLVQRGIASEEEARRFLNPTVKDLYDPFLLNDMAPAVERIRRALDQKEPICVYGDYDVDGVSASSLLSDYLRKCGAPTEVYLPSRHTEGYGLNAPAIEEIASRCRLMITVDCGITSVDLIELAKSLGLDCIVTDHHRPAAELPRCSVINPLLNGYPYPYLCGAGVAFKLVQALGGVGEAMQYIDIAALATVADVVPLADENRLIVKLGLERINENPRPGLRALIAAAGLEKKKIGAGNIAFQLAPRLNAGGRIATARRSYDLLLSPDEDDARPIAEELERENSDRKTIEQLILTDAEAQLKDFDFPAHRALVLSGSDWNAGVIGLAASRLVEKYHYPVILLSDADGVLTGSCRSIPGVDIHAALTAVSHLLTRFGGHKQAAGLTLDAAKLDDFRAELDRWLFENIPAVCYVPEQEYDMEVHFDQLTEPFVNGLDALQPTGFGNPAPVLRAAPFVIDQKGVGMDGAHLRMLFSEGGVQRSGIFWRQGHRAGSLPDSVDILFSPKLNTFMGRTSVEVELKSINSQDVLSEIDSKMGEEINLQRRFLTKVFYNCMIISDSRPTPILSDDALKEMVADNPQGTLILTADLNIARRLTQLLGSESMDVCIGSMPEDPRAFNTLCAYCADPIPRHYRRIVLAGDPAAREFPEGAEVFRTADRAAWVDELPDVDQMREVYKAVRNALRSVERWDDFESLMHLIEVRARMSLACCTASLLTLHDMNLVQLDLDARPMTIALKPMRKTDPKSSAVWNEIQRWRSESASSSNSF